MTTGLVSLLLAAAPADAADGYGFVWANQHTWSSEYTPSPEFNYGSIDANTILRTATGRYVVTMPELAGGDGNVQVTALGSDANYCKVSSWGGSVDRDVYVRCYDRNGVLADTRFTVLYQSRSGYRTGIDGPSAYLWANNPTSASYTPSSYYRFNSAGGVDTVTRSTAGVYDVRIDDIDDAGGTVLVTAYGSDPNRCKVGGWWPSGGDTLVRVYCHTPAGAPVDAQFTLSYANEVSLVEAGAEYGSFSGAYAWTGGSTAGAIGLLPTYSWSKWRSGTGLRTRSGAGRYLVRLDDMGYGNTVASVPLVTGYGSDAGHCKVELWVQSSGDALVSVGCFDAAGNRADSMFTLTWLTSVAPLI